MIDVRAMAKMAAGYTAAWNSKSAEAVASFYAEDGEIIINNGDPWTGQSRVQDMAAGFAAWMYPMREQAIADNLQMH